MNRPEQDIRVPTEARNPRTVAIDTVSTPELLRLLNAEDALVAPAVARVLPMLATVVDRTVERVRAGGRIHYFGAGTSGRLAMLDAVELPPTFNADPELVVAHFAGGEAAMTRVDEDFEDSADLGRRDAATLGPLDVAIGITASGRTPYVVGALAEARRRGADTVLLSGNPRADLADVNIAPDTGAEAIAGSTRLKAGTAAKLVLNAFSTALMVRLGQTYSNLMVSVRATNSKLQHRLLTILAAATGESAERCRAALSAADGDLKIALVTTLGSGSPGRAREALAAAGGSVRPALRRIAGDPATPRAGRSAGTWVAGLDVGGTGARIRLAPIAGDGTDRDAAAEPPGAGMERTGPGVEVRENGVDVAALVDGLAPSLDELRRYAPDGVAAAAVGLSGLPDLVDDAAVAALSRALADALGAGRTVVASDAVTAFVGALGLRPGVVLAAGTGVVALGTDLASRWRRVDGWGHLLGDDGGGAWIGMQGLRAALRARDGRRGGSTELLERVRRRFGDPASLPRTLYPRADRAGVLASFAPEVTDAALGNDSVAVDIVTRAGTLLAEAAAAAVLPGEQQPLVACTGRLFAAGALLVDPFRDTLVRLIPGAVLVPPAGTSLDGAVALARLAATAPDRVPQHRPHVWTTDHPHRE